MQSFETSSEAFSPEQLSIGRDQALAQMKWVREYSRELIESVPQELWYVKPKEMPTHVAWQVGHLAVSQYGLMLFRQRGRTPEDLEIMPGWLRKQFSRGTEAKESSDKSPTPDELLTRLDQIHSQAVKEVESLDVNVLSEPIEMPYAAYPNKLGALLFCPIHESIHAGQVGVLRRAHGLAPIR